MKASPSGGAASGRKRTIVLTLLAGVAILTCIRLGFWQLDRLAQRRAHNAQVVAHQSLPPFDLNVSPLPADLSTLQYRMAVVSGVFVPAEAVGLGSEARDGQVGVHLLVPLALPGTDQKVLVDRGWIPAGDLNPATWQQYNLPGTVTIQGRLILTQTGSNKQPASTARVNILKSVQLDVLARQVSGTILPIYLQAAPSAGGSTLPYASLPSVDLGEGPHLSYAVQWFGFALAFAVGIVLYLRRVIRRSRQDRLHAANQAGQ